MIRPGEIYMADFGPAGPHPVIVTSRESLNRGRYALVVPCTSSRFALRSKLANNVPFRAGEYGFTMDCVAQCENMLSIGQGQLDLAAGPRGVLSRCSSSVRSEGDRIRHRIELRAHMTGQQWTTAVAPPGV